ncbi:hypothetical protein N0V85_007573 [Neurospora sp. IMI 360204]|nr:hypothetical protein N0V85_007573 [Neurospora sp. IMI 360204]
MERLNINQVQTPETALSLASLHISDHTHPTGFAAASDSEAQAPSTQSSLIRHSTSATDATKDIDMANTTSNGSPVNPHNVTETSTRHHQVPTHPELEARFYDHKRYLEDRLQACQTLVHLEARKDAIELAERDIPSAILEYLEALRELAKRDIARARLELVEYLVAMRKLRRVAGEGITKKIWKISGSGLMTEEAVLRDILGATMMEE